MRFGGGFLGLKALSLGIRSLVFLSVLALSERAFGANHLMSFLSWVTVAGIALGFGASDSVTVSSDGQAASVSRSVLMASLVGIGTTSLLLLGSYWINVGIACINYGLSFWNLGLVRRRNPVLFEQISNFQMLIIWSVYFALLPLETQDLRILSLLYAFMNGVVAFIAFRTGSKAVRSAPASHEHSLTRVSVSKLVWEINYSGLTRMPFLLPVVSASMHSAFSYGYLLFEMASAMLSHYQTVFLKSRSPNIRAWIRLSAVLLAVNAASLVALLMALQFQHIVIDRLADLLGLQLNRIADPLVRADITGLAIFMLAITALQSAAFGRYAIKLEANARIVLVASAMTVFAFAISWVLSTDYPFSLFVPFGFMFLAGLLLVLVISRSISDGGDTY